MIALLRGFFSVFGILGVSTGVGVSMIVFGFLVLLGFSPWGISDLAGVSTTFGVLVDLLGFFGVTTSPISSYFTGLGTIDLDLRVLFGFSTTGNSTV